MKTLTLFLSAIYLGSIPLVAAETSPTTKLNIVVFISDDHGQLDSQAYGSTEVRTPNMAKLAAEGLKFTHAFTASPSWLPPAVTVHQGDWKLIRIFFAGENGAHRWQLYNLREDLGEKNNLVAKDPSRVQAMDELIEKFLADTQAVTPVRNPTFDAQTYRLADEGKQKSNTKQKASATKPQP